MRGISSVAENRLASQEGLCYVEEVSKIWDSKFTIPVVTPRIYSDLGFVKKKTGNSEEVYH